MAYPANMAPAGFLPVNLLGGRVYNAAIRQIPIASGYAQNIGYGDLVGIANTGTIVTHHAENWNIRVPYQLIVPPEMCIELTGSRRLTVELATTPADSITVSGVIYVEEFG